MDTSPSFASCVWQKAAPTQYRTGKVCRDEQSRSAKETPLSARMKVEDSGVRETVLAGGRSHAVLSDAIHEGFFFTLCVVVVAILAALLMKNIRLEKSTADREPEGGTDEKGKPVPLGISPEA